MSESSLFALAGPEAEAAFVGELQAALLARETLTLPKFGRFIVSTTPGFRSSPDQEPGPPRVTVTFRLAPELKEALSAGQPWEPAPGVTASAQQAIVVSWGQAGEAHVIAIGDLGTLSVGFAPGGTVRGKGKRPLALHVGGAPFANFRLSPGFRARLDRAP